MITLYMEPVMHINEDGVKIWTLNGCFHREDGPAVIYSTGRKEWMINSKRHREDGPAIICEDGSKEWYINGMRHRTDGPAIIYPNGRKEWWINGKNVSDVVNEWMKTKNYDWSPTNTWSDEIKSEFLLTFY